MSEKSTRVSLRFLLITLCLMVACHHRNSVEGEELKVVDSVTVPSVYHDVSDVFLDRSTSLWQFISDTSLVSGFVYERYPNDTLQKIFGVYAGKKEGQLKAYFSNGKVKYTESYQNNKLDGELKRWSQEGNDQLLAQLYYKNGKLHGQQKKWFPTGELHVLMNMNMGKEEGLQQAYRKNGVLYANYEAREGRTFGLKRSNLCYELDNEQVVYGD